MKILFAGTPEIANLGQLRRHGDHFQKLNSRSGSIYIAGGRADDTMNLGGIKISSAEIERVLNRVDGVIETAAVAICENGGPDELTVFAVATPNAILDEPTLLSKMNRILKAELNPLFKIQSVHLIPSMPRTSSGKIMRRNLRRELENL